MYTRKAWSIRWCNRMRFEARLRTSALSPIQWEWAEIRNHSSASIMLSDYIFTRSTRPSWFFSLTLKNMGRPGCEAKCYPTILLMYLLKQTQTLDLCLHGWQHFILCIPLARWDTPTPTTHILTSNSSPQVHVHVYYYNFTHLTWQTQRQ